MNKIHDLKIWPKYYNQILIGTKTFEVRKDDRNFKEGDELLLNEWNPETQDYTGRAITAIIVSKLEGGQFGIKQGYCVMGIRTI